MVTILGRYAQIPSGQGQNMANTVPAFVNSPLPEALISGSPRDLIIPAPGFVHDVMASSYRTVDLPRGRLVHLEFESGKGGYAVHLARSRSDWHVVAMDDTGLAVQDLSGMKPSPLTRTSFQAFADMFGKAVANLVQLPELQKQASVFQDCIATAERFVGPNDTEGGHVEAWRRARHELSMFEIEHMRDIPTYFQLESAVIQHWIKIREARDGMQYSLGGDNEAYYQWKQRVEADIRGHAEQLSTIMEWRLFMASVLSEESAFPILAPETIANALQQQALVRFYSAYLAPEGVLPENLTAIRGVTSGNEGFKGIPLPDQSVASVTWVGPFQHHADHMLIAREFHRILNPSWRSVELAVWGGSTDDIRPDDAQAIATELGGKLETVDDLLEPYPRETGVFFTGKLIYYHITPAALF